MYSTPVNTVGNNSFRSHLTRMSNFNDDFDIGESGMDIGTVGKLQNVSIHEKEGDAEAQMDDEEPTKKKKKVESSTKYRTSEPLLTSGTRPSSVKEFIDSGGFSVKDAKLMKNIASGKTPGFFFKTSDVAAMCNIMYALRDLVENMRFMVSKGGIKMGETACADNMFLFAKFKEKHFTFFECTPLSPDNVDKDGGDNDESKKITISFEPSDVYKVLRSNQQRDTMVWLYDASKKRDNTLVIIKYTSEAGTMESRYELPLLNLEPTSYEAPKEIINYVLMFDPTTINTIINVLADISTDNNSDYVKIRCDSNGIEFSVDDTHIVTHAGFKLKTSIQDDSSCKPRRNRNKTNSMCNKEDVSISDEKPVVQRLYKLSHLRNLVKCFSITDDGIIVYIFKEYPLIFEVKIGDIGHLRIALLYKDEDDDE